MVAAATDGPAARRLRRCPPSPRRFAAFLDEFVAARPGRRHVDRRPPPRRPLARRDRRRPARRGSPSSIAGAATFAALDPASLDRRRRASTATCCSGARRRCGSARPSCARTTLGPARLGLPARRRPVPAPRPRVRAARRPAGERRRPARGHAGRARRRRERARRAGRRPAGRPVPDRDRARAAARHRRADRRCARGGRGGAPTTPAVAASRPRLDAAAAAAKAALDRLRDAPARRRPAGERGRGPPRRGAVRPQDAPHDALGDADAGADPRPRPSASSTRSAPRWSGSPRDLWPTLAPRPSRCPDDDGALVRGVLDAIAAEHPDADDLLDFCREENARIEAFCREQRPHRPRRRAARHPLDAGLPARVRRRDAHLAGAARQGPEGVLRDHPDARRLAARAARVVPARGQRPDAPAADDPRGGARPLPPGRLRQPLVVAAASDLPERRCSPRAGRST